MKIIANEDIRHVQINEFLAKNTEDYFCAWLDIKGKYEGFNIDFCYHNCDAPVEFMNKIGANLLESCVESRLVRKKFSPICGFEARFVTNENINEFIITHKKTNPEMYWSSEKIAEDLSRWCIYTHGEYYVMMSRWGDVAEIYALEAANPTDGAILLSMAVKFAFETDKKSVLMMIEDNAYIETEAARIVGFEECGRYVAYRGIVE